MALSLIPNFKQRREQYVKTDTPIAEGTMWQLNNDTGEYSAWDGSGPPGGNSVLVDPYGPAKNPDWWGDAQKAFPELAQYSYADAPYDIPSDFVNNWASIHSPAGSPGSLFGGALQGAMGIWNDIPPAFKLAVGLGAGLTNAFPNLVEPGYGPLSSFVGPPSNLAGSGLEAGGGAGDFIPNAIEGFGEGEATTFPYNPDPLNNPFIPEAAGSTGLPDLSSIPPIPPVNPFSGGSSVTTSNGLLDPGFSINPEFANAAPLAANALNPGAFTTSLGSQASGPLTLGSTVPSWVSDIVKLAGPAASSILNYLGYQNLSGNLEDAGNTVAKLGRTHEDPARQGFKTALTAELLNPSFSGPFYDALDHRINQQENANSAKFGAGYGVMANAAKDRQAGYIDLWRRYVDPLITASGLGFSDTGAAAAAPFYMAAAGSGSNLAGAFAPLLANPTVQQGISKAVENVFPVVSSWFS